MTQPIWYADFEVFSNDWLLVAKRQRDGQTISIWNDTESVQNFITAYNPVLCGYNFRDYDSYILKAVLLGWCPEDIKIVNDTIINSHDDKTVVWGLFNGQPWIELPPVIDLFHDIVPRKGLKEIEANIGMSIVESSVPFDIDRPLTTIERTEVLRYCIHDVDATAALYDLRFDYLKSKSDLCELRHVDPLTMLKHTNARIVSEVMEAQKFSAPFETYEIHENVDITAIPESVRVYVEKVNTDNCMDNDAPKVEFLFHGCPCVVGLGGIHAARPSYKETSGQSRPSGEDRIILMQDIGSYYPSLIINNGYMSRAVADPSVYKTFYDTRMAAKASGDKATADAAKLVLNTTYGTMKDQYNKMFDPMQATRVCLSGQLYIIDLIENIHRVIGDDLTLIQLNTDGWVVSCPRVSLRTVQRVVEGWQRRTHFVVETDEVQSIVQANVNNYVLRFADGKIKAKGGVVAKYAGGDFKSNSATIIDEAVVSFLLDNVPVADTIDACNDIERFQIVAKAGRTFSKVVHQLLYPLGDKPWVDCEGVEREDIVQRVNRVYATIEPWYGGIYKVKMEDGKETGRSRIPLTPEHCIIDNDNALRDSGKLLTSLDKAWYITLAKEKAKAFITRKKEEREQMSTVDEKTNELQQEVVEPKAKPTRKKADPKESAQVPEQPPIPSFKQRLLALQGDMAKAASGVKFDKVIDNISYEYADTSQYKMWLCALCTSHDLIFKLDVDVKFLGIIGQTKNKGDIYAAQADGAVTMRDVYTDEFETYCISGFGSNMQPGYCNGAAQTNMLRNFILNNYLLDNKGREGDDQAFSAATDSGAAKNGYVSGAAKAEIKQAIVDDKAEDASFATDMFAKALYDNILAAQKIDPKFCVKLVAEHFEADGTPKVGANGKSTLKKTKAVATLTKAEEIIVEGEKAAE